MGVNIHITIIELNTLHTKRQNLFQEIDAVIHLLFFFKQKTAYEIGLGIPAEPLFRSNRRSLLLALRLLWKTPIFPSNSRFPRLCAKCLLKLKRLVSILPMTKSKKWLARLVLRLT